MKGEAMTAVHWFSWFGWFSDKVETWLEGKAAEGWHLIKADRMLLRFHFVRGKPKKVRIIADYPAEVSDEYVTIFQDAGWELVGKGLGWYIWRAEYVGENRPEAFNDINPLIERNHRLLKLIVICLVLQIPALLPNLIVNLTKPSAAVTFGPVLVTLYVVLLAGLITSAALTYMQIRRLKALKR